MSGPERAVASLSREKVSCEEWAALREELADLQASPRRGNQEIDRALQNRLQTSYTQETTKPPREIECLECEDKSDSPLEEDTEQFLLWRLLSRIAVRRRSWMRSASDEDAKEDDDWTDLESDLVQRGAGEWNDASH